ncbi:hypothetical protein BSKO_01743 [Bryopsis sp. KO-2023]|nr:hypothetical protein BSKO_01743 [Bryopsis sp. KO-2023]
MAMNAVSLAFCQALPKVELHAHLNGSLRDSTLAELAGSAAAEGGDGRDVGKLVEKGDRTLSEVFQVFDLIHEVTTDHSTIARITKEAIEDFRKDGVVYMELRSTPKCCVATGMTKRSYVEAMLAGRKDFFRSNPTSGVVVKFILSINRSESQESALETVVIADEFRGDNIVGIDLSGNPTKGDFAALLPALELAKAKSLPTTLHAGEIPNFKETRMMLDFGPDRVSHMCCTDDEIEAILLQAGIPLELCLTSNVLTESVATFEDHHFKKYARSNHPVVLCTDDPGVFSTTLSREFWIAAATFGLNHKDLIEMVESSVEHIFAKDAREGVKKVITEFKAEHYGD